MSYELGLDWDEILNPPSVTEYPQLRGVVTDAGNSSADGSAALANRSDVLLHRGAIWTSTVIQRVVTLGVIMTISLVGNVAILVLLGCYSRYRKRHSRVNIFIINLAIGDLFVCLFTMVSEILFVAFGDWVLGNAACKLVTYVQIVTLAGTTFILTSMSFDRYLAICRPLCLGTTNARARKMIFVSWFVAFIFASPQPFIFGQSVEGQYADGSFKHSCRTVGYTARWQRKTYFTFLTTYILIVPAILITFCYVNVVIVVWRQGRDIPSINENGVGLRRALINTRSRAKIRTLKMTFAIIATFLCCWTPYFVTTLIRVYSNNKYTIAKSVMVFAETIVVLPSALNPILYGFFNVKLARSLTETCYRRSLSSPFRFKLKASKPAPTEYLTVTLRTPSARKNNNLIVRQPEVIQLNSSSGSFERPRSSGIITEENMNGVRLRVRFTPKDNSYHSYSHSDENDYHVTPV